MKNSIITLIYVISFLFAASGGYAKVKLPTILGNNMVLQQQTVLCRGQSGRVAVWHESLSMAQDVAYLSELEKEMIQEINKVRTNPKAYANCLKRERVYYRGALIERPGETPIRTSEGRAALEACITALEKSEPVAALLPDECLSQAAGTLAAEQAATGAMGHVCADGRTLKDRITNVCVDRYMRMAENISYGGREARAIVIRFLIDDGIPSRGHRVNLMNPSYTHCGAAMASHPVYKDMCVIDFAALH